MAPRYAPKTLLVTPGKNHSRDASNPICFCALFFLRSLINGVMSTFTKLRIGQRMAIGFSAIIFLMVALTMVGIYRVNSIEKELKTVNDVTSVKQRLAINFRGSVHDRAISLRDIVLNDDVKRRQQESNLIDKLAGDYAEAATQLSAILEQSDDAKDKNLLNSIRKNEMTTLPLIEEVVNARESGDVETAKLIMSTRAGPAFVTWLESINSFIDLQESKNALSVIKMSTTAKGFAALMIGATLFALVLGTIIAIALTRSIVFPLNAALSAALDVSDGKLDNSLTVRSQDEFGQLLGAMEKMRQRVKILISELEEMTRRHDIGEISYRMNAEALPGEFGSVIRDTNALVAAHISVKMQVVQLAGRYAVGELSADMDRLPGEKAILTETMDQVKFNLTSISEEIGDLTRSASKGDFSARGMAEAYQNDFRIMVENLNVLMETAETNLKSLSSFLNAIAAGDLDARMRGDFRGVFATMSTDANETAKNLTSIVQSIYLTSETISAAAKELARGSLDLSQRTEQQAASIQETAASMEELTSTVKKNASSAQEAHQLASSSADTAREGGRIVREVVTKMEGIEQSSLKIAEITAVIDSIAFQTNILALNAAVEAARAGDQGRGFAVVATEVRSLAQRAATSAKEIKDLIEISSTRITDGAFLVREAGATMEDVVLSVQRVTDIVRDISAASRDQSASIEQVNTVISRMDGTTQQNAALVEESAGSASELQRQAAKLLDAVGAFKLRHEVDQNA